MSQDDEHPYAKVWAKLVTDGASELGVNCLLQAINEVTKSHRANQADVLVACTQILGQSIPLGGPTIAAELRHAVMSMIDGYTFQVAVEATP